MKIYFYIIQRNGAIHEIEDVGNRFEQSIGLWQKGGIIFFPNLGMGINAVDISNILNEEKYQEFITTTRPKEYVKNGVWYDGKENGILRYSKWREDEIESFKRLETKLEDIKELPGAKERISAMMQFNVDKYKKVI